MKLLILGGNGMAGHVLVDYFQKQGGYNVFYTTRDPKNKGGLLLDVNDSFRVEQLVRSVRPDIIINAVGVLNQYAGKDQVTAYQINGLLPHLLQRTADSIGARFIHISTDCVFEGKRMPGLYEETDQPDGTSAYALTKILGEVKAPGHLTIRTSIIGPEIRPGGIGLLNWFLQQSGDVDGYRRVFWNGVTTLELAKAIRVLMNEPLDGLIHLVHPEPISKYDLLLLFKDIWKREDIRIVPKDEPVQDRTLRSTRADLLYDVPHYSIMLKELLEWTEAQRNNVGPSL
ncbi:dTDP-4-dehydrorhamnose reductase family protein [Paenibacillus terrae]|uniref:dTDP-4-dehydrorhamnose reductase n=1 Tax=Paenibacillus terrae (strain HPL-003) TaxID=985665 RepID=G7VVF1_PAETH|nr:SDR family oxidoreductase [Paenibacillus terrae]AET56985.1 nad dependent epimerase/dehydratase [Paenibacillus terrae HPL-003]